MVKKTRGRKVLRIAAIILASALLLIVVGSLYLYFHTATLKGVLERSLSKREGLTVTIGRLGYRILPFRAAAESVLVAFEGKPGRAEVRIGRAAVSGGLKRLIKGQKPYFDSLTVSDLDAEFSARPGAEPSAPPGRVGDLVRLASENLSFVGALAVKGASVRVRPAGKPAWEISASGMSLRTAAAGAKTSLTINAEKIFVQSAEPPIILSSAARAEVGWPREEPFWLEGTLALSGASISFPGRSWELAGFGLDSGFRAIDRDIEFSSFRFDLPRLAAISGSGRAEWGGNANLTASLVMDVPSLEGMKRAFAPFLPPSLPSFSLEGPASWMGDLRWESVSGGSSTRVEGRLLLPSVRFVMKRAGLSIDQTLQADLHLQAGTEGLRVKGSVEGRQGRWLAGRVRAEEVAFRAPILFDGRRAESRSLTARVRDLTMTSGGRALPLTDLSISGPATLDLRRQTGVAGPLSIEIPALGTFSLQGELGYKAGPRADLSLESRDLEIGKALEAFRGFVPGRVKDWKPEGRLNLSLRIGNAADDSSRFLIRGTGALLGFAFQNSSGGIVSEKLEPSLEFEAEFSTPARAIPFSLKLELARGETLLEAAYIDWLSTSIRLDVRGALDPRSRRFSGVSATVLSPPFGEIRATGTFDLGPRFRADIALRAPSIDIAALSAFLGRTVGGGLASWEIQGRADAEARLRFGLSWEASGNVRIREASGSRKDGAYKFADANLDLPFSFSRGESPGGGRSFDPLSPGRLEIRSLETPLAGFTPLRIDYYSTRNLFLFFPLEAVLWGSRVRLGQSVLAVNPASRAVAGVSNLTLNDLDFSRLPFASEAFRISGRGSIPTSELDIRPEGLRLKGRMEGELFGGRLAVDDIRVSDPLSADRRIALNAAVAGLDLEKLTASVPFGEVTGLVDVSVRELSLSYGQPESFSLSIASTARKGVRQRVSLRAVNSLSIISSAGPSSSSNNLLTRLVPSFAYSRIGIACALKNDVFSLQGTIVEKGVQYLVRRGPLYGIDVVNGTPNNRIGFKDMLERLKRIGQNPETK